jgi:NAD(P)-dependent dehydrogenase (short-subunit alcohol dehydrogenase family)
MRFGIVGLGRIGGGVSLHALEKGHQVVGYNRSPNPTRVLAEEGVEPAFSLGELVRELDPPRFVLIYVPHGEPTDKTVAELKGLLRRGDLVADGGNSHWKDSVRHHDALKANGIAFLDVGTSGGVEGARRGACFMVGGKAVVLPTDVAEAGAVEAAAEAVERQLGPIDAWVDNAMISVFSRLSRWRPGNPSVRKVIITDRDKAYLWPPPLRRQICWAHLIRDFQAMVDQGARAVLSAKNYCAAPTTCSLGGTASGTGP